MPKTPDPQSPPDAPEPPVKTRKERVLHTRIPAVLEQELKDLAENLRVPVSNVVRTILEDAVNTVDVVGRRAESELRGVAERFGQGRRRPRRLPAWQQDYRTYDFTSDGRLVCSWRTGTEAHLGIRDDGGPRVLLGDECLPFRAKSGASDNDGSHLGDSVSPEEES